MVPELSACADDNDDSCKRHCAGGLGAGFAATGGCGFGFFFTAGLLPGAVVPGSAAGLDESVVGGVDVLALGFGLEAFGFALTGVASAGFSSPAAGLTAADLRPPFFLERGVASVSALSVANWASVRVGPV